MLCARIDVPKLGPINFFVTHFSYFDMVQCRNAEELLHFISLQNSSLPTSNFISVCKNSTQAVPVLVGDFNTYIAFEDPMAAIRYSPYFSWLQVDLLSGEQMSSQSKCNSFQSQYASAPTFKDVWLELHPNEPGLSFSNMPWPGLQVSFVLDVLLLKFISLQSRPDRILLANSSSSTSCLHPVKAEVKENGAEYRRRYYWSVMWDRAKEKGFLLSPSMVFFLVAWSIYLCRLSRLCLIPIALCFVVPYWWLLRDYMEEEFFTSDHQIVTATLKILC